MDTNTALPVTRKYQLHPGMPGERLILLRGRFGLSMEDLAKLANVSIHTVRRVEHGELVHERSLMALAHALGVPLSYLYKPID